MSARNAWTATLDELEAWKDPNGLEDLTCILLGKEYPSVEPTGGSGDEGCDAIAGLDAPGDGKVAIVITQDKDSKTGRVDRSKLYKDFGKIKASGLDIEQVVVSTSRRVNPDDRKRLKARAQANGWDLRVCGQRWLAQQLLKPENLDHRHTFLHLPRPQPRYFLDAATFGLLLEGRGTRLEVPLQGREDEIAGVFAGLETQAKLLLVEAAGGLGKSRLLFECAGQDPEERGWFFVAANRAYRPAHLSEIDDNERKVVVVEDAHNEKRLDSLLAELETLKTRPQVILVTRPGYDTQLAQAYGGSAFEIPPPKKVRLGPLSPQAIAAILLSPPLSVKIEKLTQGRAHVVERAEGNPLYALMMGEHLAKGGAVDGILWDKGFAQHVDRLINLTAGGDQIKRELLALVAALGHLGSSPVEVRRACGLLGCQPAELQRLLRALADVGLLVEETPQEYTIKPDLLREQVIRFSFFDSAVGRKVRYDYLALYRLAAGDPDSRQRMLEGLGDALVGHLPQSGTTLKEIGDELEREAGAAPDAAALLTVARAAQALGRGAPTAALQTIDALLARLPDLEGVERDTFGLGLVQALERAQLGDIAGGWTRLLRLGELILLRDDCTQTEERWRKLVVEAYDIAPVAYGLRDDETIAEMQKGMGRAVRDALTGRLSPPRSLALALAARALLSMTFTQDRLDPHSHVVTVFGKLLGARSETRQALEAGAAAFKKTFLGLPPQTQLEQLEALDTLCSVSGGHGVMATQPNAKQQALAESILNGRGGIEPWLVQRLDQMPKPVAAAVVDGLRLRAQMGGRPQRVRPSKELQRYLDLIDPTERPRLGYYAEKALHQRQAQRYATEIANAKDPCAYLDHCGEWLRQLHDAYQGRRSPSETLELTFAALSRKKGARALAAHILSSQPVLAAHAESLIGRVGARNASLRRRWLTSPDPLLRTAAVWSAAHLPDAAAKELLLITARDPDSHIRRSTWRQLYGLNLGTPTVSWRLDLALEIMKRDDYGYSETRRLLWKLLRDRQLGTRVRLTPARKAGIKSLVLRTVELEQPPHSLGQILLNARQLGVESVAAWVQARVDFLNREVPQRLKEDPAAALRFDKMPDELSQIVFECRGQPEMKRLWRRLRGQISRGSLHWLAGQAAVQAMLWMVGGGKLMEVYGGSVDSASVLRHLTELARSRAGTDSRRASRSPAQRPQRLRAVSARSTTA